MKQILLTLSCIIFSLVVPVSTSAQLSPASLSVSPSSVTIQNGSLSTLDFRISNAIRLGGYEFAVKYNPAILRVESASDVTLGTFLASTGRTATLLTPNINNSTGRVTLGAFSFGSQTGPSGSGSMALIRFRAIAPGTSTITFENVILSTSDTTPQTQPSTVSSGSITVNVPLTSTPSPTRTGTPIPTNTRTPTPSRTGTPIPTSTKTPTPIITSTPTPSPTRTGTPTPSPTRTGTPTASPTGQITIAPSATNTPQPTNTRIPSTTNSPTPEPLTGDCDNDGLVDGVDFVCWLNHYNQNTSNGPRDGDYNSDGKVDGIDYTIWLANYGRRR